jgi:predicted transposase YbfD/YdcC
MPPAACPLPERSRLAILLDHFAAIEDPRDVRRISHPLSEVLLLVVCGTIADCDDYEHIAEWGAAHLEFLRQHLPYKDGVPGGRWLTILMNRINPALFQAAFTAWVRAAWPERPEFVAIDGKTSRRSHDRAVGAEPIHLVSAFATTARLVLGQEAVAEKSGELTAIPELLARLAEEDGLQGALVSIDAIATTATIAQAIRDAGADYLLAVKANQPSLRAEVEAAFAAAPPGTVETTIEHDKGHGRIETRSVGVLREVDWLQGERRFPGELRLPDVACLIRVAARTERRAAARPASKPATTSLRLAFPPPKPQRPSAAIGASRTACTGSSTSSSVTTRSSVTTSPACARATAPETWPSSGISPSTSSAPPPPTSDPSGCAGSSPAGTPTTSTASSR